MIVNWLEGLAGQLAAYEPGVTRNGKPLLVCPPVVTFIKPVLTPEGTYRKIMEDDHIVVDAATGVPASPFVYGINCTVPLDPRFEPKTLTGVFTGPYEHVPAA